MTEKDRSESRAGEGEPQESCAVTDKELSDRAFFLGLGTIIFLLGLGLLCAVGWAAMTLAHAVTIATSY